MHWILQDGFFSDVGWDSLIANLERFGIDYSVHAVVPKIGELIPEPLIGHKNVICIGSYSMRHVALRNSWIPGVFDLFSQDFEQQREHWGEHMLNFHSVVCSLEDARFSVDQMFVRPTTDTKYFSGRVFDAETFRTWQRTICDLDAKHGTSLTPKTQVQLSNPVAIYAEYRFWVVAGEIVTQSLYKRGSQVMYSSEVDQRVVAFVKARISEWSPHETFVIDACDSERGMKIVEINTLNSSGFYAADVQRLILSLEDRYTQ